VWWVDGPQRAVKTQRGTSQTLGVCDGMMQGRTAVHVLQVWFGRTVLYSHCWQVVGGLRALLCCGCLRVWLLLQEWRATMQPRFCGA
jgi:hypothetical protein